MKSDSQLNDSKYYPQKFEDLSFDGWINLHKSEPERFDKYRRKLLNDLVESAPERSKARLKGLIFQMEAEARRAKSLMAYNIRLAMMMMDTLGELNDQFKQLVADKFPHLKQNQSPAKTATVLSFNRQTETGDDS